MCTCTHTPSISMITTLVTTLYHAVCFDDMETGYCSYLRSALISNHSSSSQHRALLWNNTLTV